MDDDDEAMTVAQDTQAAVYDTPERHLKHVMVLSE